MENIRGPFGRKRIGRAWQGAADLITKPNTSPNRQLRRSSQVKRSSRPSASMIDASLSFLAPLKCP